MSSSRGVLLAAACGVLLCLPDYGSCQSRSQVVFEDDHENKCPPDKPHCVTVEQCRPAQLQIRRGQHPIICDWQKTTSLVCCQEPINVDVPPSEGTGKPGVHPEPAHPEPVPPGPDQPGPDQPEPSQPEPDQPEPVTSGPVDPEPVNPEPVNPEPDRPGPISPQPVNPEPVSPGPVAPKPGSRDEGEEDCPCSVDTGTDDTANAGNAL